MELNQSRLLVRSEQEMKQCKAISKYKSIRSHHGEYQESLRKRWESINEKMALSMPLSAREVCHQRETLFPGREAQWPPQETFVKWQLFDGLFCPDSSTGSKEDTGVEGSVGRGVWKELLQDRHPPGEGEGLPALCLPSVCPLPARGQELVFSLSSAALQPCQDQDVQLCFNGVNHLGSLRPVYSNNILHRARLP